KAGIACWSKLEITPPSISNHPCYGTRKANRWLRKLGVFDGKSPAEVARMEAGARLTESMSGLRPQHISYAGQNSKASPPKFHER
ncbi:MAG: hypothetical protein WA183_02500, partial [Chthoniobacterales bacterium]